jgi:hypothetical protein
MKSIFKAFKTKPVFLSFMILSVIQLFISATIVVIVFFSDVYVQNSSSDMEGITAFLLGTGIALLGSIVLVALCLSRLRTFYIILLNVIFFILCIVLFFIGASSFLMASPFLSIVLLFAFWQYFLVYGLGYLFYFRFRNVFLTICSNSFWFFSVIVVSISERLVKTSDLTEQTVTNNFALLWQGPELIFVILYLVLISLLLIVDNRFKLAKWQHDLRSKVRIRKRNYLVFGGVVLVALIVVSIVAPLFWRVYWVEETRRRQVEQEQEEQRQRPDSNDQKDKKPDSGDGDYNPDDTEDQEDQEDQEEKDDSEGQGDQGDQNDQNQDQNDEQNPGGRLPQQSPNMSMGNNPFAVIRYGESYEGHLNTESGKTSEDLAPRFISVGEGSEGEDDGETESTKADYPYQYFRSEVYDEYSSYDGFTRNYSDNYGDIDGDNVRGFYYYEDVDPDRSQEVIHRDGDELYQMVMMLGPQSQLVFGRTQVYELGFLSERPAPYFFAYRNGVLVTSDKNKLMAGDTFYILSNIDERDPKALQDLLAPQSFDLNYGEKPSYTDLYSYDIARLVDQIVGTERNYYKQMELIEKYLHDNYELEDEGINYTTKSYKQEQAEQDVQFTSTNNEPSEETNQSTKNYAEADFEHEKLTLEDVKEFLFSSKKGSVPMFSAAFSALVYNLDNDYLVRTVAGFKTNTYVEDFDGFLLATSDLHYWNEVFFKGVGWITFDPVGDLKPDSEEKKQDSLDEDQKKDIDEHLNEKEKDIKGREDLRDDFRDKPPYMYDGDEDYNEGINDYDDFDDDPLDGESPDPSPPDQPKQDDKMQQSLENFLNALMEFIKHTWYLCCCCLTLLVVLVPPLSKYFIWKFSLSKGKTKNEQESIEIFYDALQRVLGYFGLRQEATETHLRYVKRLEEALRVEILSSKLSEDLREERLSQVKELHIKFKRLAWIYYRVQYSKSLPVNAKEEVYDLVVTIARMVIKLKGWKILPALYLKI